MDATGYLPLIAGTSYYAPGRPIRLSHLAVQSEDPIPGLENIEIRGLSYYGYRLFDDPKVIQIRDIRKYVTSDMIIKLRAHGDIYVIADMYVMSRKT